VFGWLDGDNEQWGYPVGDFAEKSYKGRVSFEDAVINEDGTANQFSGVLGSPSPKWVGAYLEQPANGKMKTYNSDDAKIRGNKFYFGKSEAQVGNAGNGNENVGTKFHPVGVGSDFTATIHFENLNEKELALLLQAIKLSENLRDGNPDFQLIGKAKPYGYGRVEMSNLIVKTRSIQEDFTVTEKAEELVELYNSAEVNAQELRIHDYIKSKTTLVNDAQYLGVKKKKGNNPDFGAYRKTVLTNTGDVKEEMSKNNNKQS
jgi:CRISPR-associated protein (TIGR03986 family)